MAFKAAKAKQIRQSDLYNSVVDLAKYTEDEFAQVASALQSDDPFTVLYVAPTKPRTGMMVYADGTHWNPGFGEGFYEYTSAGAWNPLFVSALNCVTSIAGNKGSFTLNSTSGITNTVNDIKLLQASASQFGAVKVDGTSITAAAGVISATPPSSVIATFTAALGADVNLNNVANFFDGPSVAQGTTGTFLVTGFVSLVDTAGAAVFTAKLYDGTTTYAASSTQSQNAGAPATIALSAIVTNPTGNLRIAAKDANSTSGKIKFNSTGFSKDSIISAVRVL